MIATLFAGASVLVATFDSACKQPPTLGFNLSVPGSIQPEVAWYELGAFSSGACPPASELAGGIPAAGPTARLVFAASTTSPPAFGDLPRGNYAFAAVARANDCSVIASGCAPVNLSDVQDVTITLDPIPTPSGACETGAICNDAVCVAGPGSGTGCSLAFVGGGPLADPLGQDRTLLSPPSIVATSSGFLIAYREFDPDLGDARLTMLPVDDYGNFSPPTQTDLPQRCTQSPETDGVGLGFSGTAGTVAVARRSCPGSPPGVDIFSVNAFGVIGSRGFSPTAGDSVSLSQAHALAYTTSGVLLTMVDERTHVPQVSVVSGISLNPPAAAIGDLISATSAYVGAADMGTGLLALGASGSAADGGVDSGGDPPIDGSVPVQTASFVSVPQGSGVSMLPAANDFPAGWVSVSGVGTRLLVATNGSPTSNPVVWYAYNVGVVAPAAVDGFGPQAMGSVLFGDVALHADNAFFAIAVGDTISLAAFRKASTYPEMLVENDLSTDPRIPIGSIRNGLVAVAADNTRVAVVWGTGRNVSNLEDLGGYAVFACAP